MQNPTAEMIRHFYERTEKHRKYVIHSTRLLGNSLSPDIKLNLLLRGIRHDLSKYLEGNILPYVWIAEMYRCKRLKLPFEYPEGAKEATKAATSSPSPTSNSPLPVHKTKRLQRILTDTSSVGSVQSVEAILGGGESHECSYS